MRRCQRARIAKSIRGGVRYRQSPCATANREDLIPDGVPACVRDAIRSVDDIDQLGADCHFALVQDSLTNTLRVALAARNGALVAVLETWDEETIPLWRLVAECALRVNTTAAGGNASLMTLEA